MPRHTSQQRRSAQQRMNKKSSTVVIETPTMTLESLNELISVNKIELPRISVNGVILGCVSAGKSTLVNAILVSKLSDTKMKRTTMLPQVYIEGSAADDMSYNVSDILKQNTKMNEDIINGKIILTTENCKPVYHTIPPLYDIIEFPSNDIHLDMYDIPGLNDSTTENIYYDYIDKSFHEFDVIFVVVDIQESFNTSSSIKILDNIITNAQKNTEKTVNVCIIANKCDDLKENEDSRELEFVDEEYAEMFDQIQKEVGNRFDTIQNIKYNILKMSAEDSFIYRMYSKNPDVELDPKLINKFGLNEFGKHKWSKWSADKKNKKIKEFLGDGDIGERFKMCGFAGFQNYLLNTINYKRQYEIISSNIKLEIAKIPQYSDAYSENITDAYIKYGALSSKMFHTYSTKCNLGEDKLSMFINNSLQDNLDGRFDSLDLNIINVSIFEMCNKFKENIMKTANKIRTTLGGLFKTELDDHYKTIESKQNNWIVSSFDKPETYNNIAGIIEKLTNLQQNGYIEFESLISNTINQTIQTEPNLILNDKNHKHDLIKYIKYIQTLGCSIEDCFEFLKKCYVFKISTETSMYHTGLLDLQLNQMNYSKFNTEFSDYLYNMKVLNLFIFHKVGNFPFNPNEFASPEQKSNIMSLFQFLLQLYNEINVREVSEVNELKQSIAMPTTKQSSEVIDEKIVEVKKNIEVVKQPTENEFDIVDSDDVAEEFSDSSSGTNTDTD